MKRVIFVGINNKSGMQPLDSRTKSGQLIDRIIDGLDKTKYIVLKSNLVDENELDKKDLIKNPWFYVKDWIDRTQYNFRKDIIITLGNEVYNAMYDYFGSLIKLNHPSYIWSNENKNSYVDLAIMMISNKIMLDDPKNIHLIIHSFNHCLCQK